MAETQEERGDNVLSGTLWWGLNDSEVHPSFRSYVNNLHVALGTCQVATSLDWSALPHCEKHFAGERVQYCGVQLGTFA